MARARFIRPEFFTDEKISDLPFGACFLFEGIWCHADMRGVFECSTRVLRGLIFPMRDGIDTDTVGVWLGLLEAAGMIDRFSIDGKAWGAVTNWSRHQAVTNREVEIGSERPLPPGWADPPEWAGIIAKAVEQKRVKPGSARHRTFQNVPERSRSYPEHTQNTTPSPSPTPSPTPALAEGEAPAPAHDGIKGWLAGHGLKITGPNGADLVPEWKAVTKGLKQPISERILLEARPGIQWPSEFKEHRKARGI